MGKTLPGYRTAILDANNHETTEGELCVLLDPRPTGVMMTAAIEPARDGADLRWGVVFYSLAEKEKRLGAIYFDRTGRSGALNDLPVSFGKGAFLQVRKVLLPPYE